MANMSSNSLVNSDAPLENNRNWLQVPSDVMLIILLKLGNLDILESVQFVCRLWYNLCKEPSLWQAIHIENPDKPELELKHEKMMRNAVDRSAGGLIYLNMEGFGSDELFSYVASRSSQLKRLRLARCHNITADAVVEALGKLPSLEELELTLCSRLIENTIPIIKSCPFVTTFKSNKLGSINPFLSDNEEALAIAGNMPELRHLQLIGNSMTSSGLTAILDGCPHLLSLDLRACYQLDLAGNLGKRLLQQIKDLRRPYASTVDYDYNTTADYSDFESVYEDECDGLSSVSEDSCYYYSDSD